MYVGWTRRTSATDARARRAVTTRRFDAWDVDGGCARAFGAPGAF